MLLRMVPVHMHECLQVSLQEVQMFQEIMETGGIGRPGGFWSRVSPGSNPGSPAAILKSTTQKDVKRFSRCHDTETAPGQLLIITSPCTRAVTVKDVTGSSRKPSGSSGSPVISRRRRKRKSLTGLPMIPHSGACPSDRCPLLPGTE